MSFASEIEVIFAIGSLKWNRTVNENGRVIKVVSVAEFREQLICDNVRSCLFKCSM